MSCRKVSNCQRVAGFTLLEVLVASALMVMVFAFAMRSMRIGNNSVETAQLTTLATQYLQDEAERVRTLNWIAIQALPDEDPLGIPAHFSASKISDHRISIIRRVEDVSGYPDMKEITLEANWISHQGIPSTRTLILRYAKNGMYDYYYGTL